MLGLGAEVRHSCEESEPAGVSAAQRQGGLDGAKKGRSDALQPLTRINSRGVEPMTCMSRPTCDDYMLG